MVVLVWLGAGEGPSSFFDSTLQCLWNTAHWPFFAQAWYFYMRQKAELHFQPKAHEQWGSQSILRRYGPAAVTREGFGSCPARVHLPCDCPSSQAPVDSRYRVLQGE